MTLSYYGLCCQLFEGPLIIEKLYVIKSINPTWQCVLVHHFFAVQDLDVIFDPVTLKSATSLSPRFNIVLLN